MVPLLRGKSSPSSTLATMHVEVQKSSSTTTVVVHGKEQHGKGGGTPKRGPKECKEGNTPKLLKGHPPRRKVDSARGKSVAKSPRDVASPRQESPRNDGEFDRIWRTLGLSGPEDFAIPAAAWEAMKVRSASDLLPRSRLHEASSPGIGDKKHHHQLQDQEESELCTRVVDSVSITDAAELSRDEPVDSAKLNACRGVVCGAAGESKGDDDSSSTTTELMSNISPNGRFRRIIDYWEKGELLGRGSFGSVYEGISNDGFFFAVKEVSLLDQGNEGKQSVYQLEQEIALLSQFEHENIVQYYGTDKDDSKLYIFLELVTKGSLMNLYQRYNLRDSQVSAYTRQILHGLKYLHAQNVVHRDIKCANILVDANGSVKLADFGLAKATKLNDVKSCKGTAFWMAPEVVNRRNQGYGLPADMWSLGCTVLEMLTRQIPYSHLECMQALFRIGRGVPPPVPDFLSPDARDFILQCLQVNPNDRPTAAQLLDHSFVRRSLSTSLSGSASPYIGRKSWKLSPMTTDN
ncbi:hypothetical protein GH714_001853 [Hevea brasiliensis]|uniref:mitogen-activated protein kinase kinase kinase n=1 Tax=Hevea brasiliensis TaxID=3981 RepID=A0A6A6L703_HEVBR|nr:hypothetical protein GH714_001853 [Hevea brasiliensis]